MESLSVFDTAWRVLLAGAVALAPGTLFWMLVLSVVVLVRRLTRRQQVLKPAGGAAQP